MEISTPWELVHHENQYHMENSTTWKSVHHGK